MISIQNELGMAQRSRKKITALEHHGYEILKCTINWNINRQFTNNRIISRTFFIDGPGPVSITNNNLRSVGCLICECEAAYLFWYFFSLFCFCLLAVFRHCDCILFFLVGIATRSTTQNRNNQADFYRRVFCDRRHHRRYTCDKNKFLAIKCYDFLFGYINACVLFGGQCRTKSKNIRRNRNKKANIKL